MIPGFVELLRTFGVNAAFAPLLVAVGLTGLVFFVPALFRWFEERKC
jgi:hypothetical protein